MVSGLDSKTTASSLDLLDFVRDFQAEFLDERSPKGPEESVVYLRKAYLRYQEILTESASLLHQQGYRVFLDDQMLDRRDFKFPTVDEYIENTLLIQRSLAAFEDEEEGLTVEHPAVAMSTRGPGGAVSYSIGRVVVAVLSCGLSMLGGGAGTQWEALGRRLMRFMREQDDIRAVLDAIQKAARRGNKADLAGLIVALLELLWEHRGEVRKIIQRAVGRRIAAKLCANFGARLIPFVGWILFAVSLAINIVGLAGLVNAASDPAGKAEAV